MPLGGGFIPPFGGVGLSPHRGGFIPAKVWFYPPKGVVSSPNGSFGGGGGILPLWGGFVPPFQWLYPPIGWGGGVTCLGVEGYGPSLCQPTTIVPEYKFGYGSRRGDVGSGHDIWFYTQCFFFKLLFVYVL